MQTNKAKSSNQSRGGLHRSSGKYLGRVGVMTQRAKGVAGSRFLLASWNIRWPIV